MRGLNVYCCPTCGHYGFFQLVANAVCPHCSIAMIPLPIPYQDFMELDYPQRQVLISRHILNASHSLDASKKSIAPYASPPVHTSGKAKTAKSSKKTSNSSKKGAASPAKSSETRSETSAALTENSIFQKKNPVFSAGTLPLQQEVSGSSEEVSAAQMKSAAPADPDSHHKGSDSSSDPEKEALYQELQTLREKNDQLEQTISWMHDLIWELTRKLHITENP